MGANQCHVVNMTGNHLNVITFNNSDLVYLIFRDIYSPSRHGQPITVDGLAGGGAVKVGVIYHQIGRHLLFDLFRVQDGATLTIRRVTEEGDVTYDMTPGVELLKRGAIVRIH